MTEKGAFIDNLADEAETEAVIQHIATMYHIPKTVDGGFKNNDIIMRDADGVVFNDFRETKKIVENALRDHPQQRCVRRHKGYPSKRRMPTCKHGTTNGKRSEISNRQYYVRKSARSRRRKCRSSAGRDVTTDKALQKC